MSTEDGSQENNDSPLKGPKVNTAQVQTLNSLQRTNGGSLGTLGLDRQTLSYAATDFYGEQGGQRRLFDALGYTTDLKVGHYVAKYERGPGIVRGIVDKPVRDCWAGDVEITEADDTSEEETQFEEEVRRFVSGEYTRLPPASRLRGAHRWARLLEFSLLLIGVSDAGPDETGAQQLSEEVDENAIDSMEDIDYLSVFDQRRVDWENTELVEDPTDPRYNLPETYSVDVGDDRNVDIHHSRIIHMVEEPDEDELRSPSVLQPIYNRLDDLQKLLGGSAEMFWRSAYPGLVLTPPTDSDGVPMRFDDDGESVADQIRKYRENLDRLHRVTGNLEKLDTDVASPDDQIQVQMEDISAHIDMPMSIIRGNETGERATEEDRAMYHEFVGGLREGHCEEQGWRPLLNRLLEWGALTEPNSGDDGQTPFEIEWPALEELSEQEEADVALTWAQAVKEASGGKPQTLATAPERRKWVLGMDPEMGSEAPDAADPEELAAESLEVPDEFDEPTEQVEDEEPEEGGQEA